MDGACSSKRKRGGRPKSEYWNEAEKIGKDKWKCNHCQEEFAGGATRIQEHITGGDGNNIRKCPKYRANQGPHNASSSPQEAVNTLNQLQVPEMEKQTAATVPLAPKSTFTQPRTDASQQPPRLLAPSFIQVIEKEKGSISSGPGPRKWKLSDVQKDKAHTCKNKAPTHKDKDATKKGKAVAIPRASDPEITPPLVPTDEPAPNPTSTATGLSPGSLWDKGLSDDFFHAIHAPKRFVAPVPFSESNIEELGAIELSILKGASLIQSLATVNKRFACVVNELNNSREELETSREELKRTRDELQASREETNKTREELLLSQKDVAKLKSSVESLHQENQDSAKNFHQLNALLGKMQETLHQTEAELAESKTEVENILAQVSIVLERSFPITLEQIRCLDLTFADVDEPHWKDYSDVNLQKYPSYEIHWDSL